jgi:dihydropteroate synthase
MSRTYTFKWKDFHLELGPDPLIMGIINVTPDSFSDGGKFFSINAAVEHGEKLVRQGAHILDIGGESTRPFSNSVSEEEQIQRVVPVIKALAQKIRVPISIDTTKATVAKAALDVGASIVNDISALQANKAMGTLVAKANVPLILMHMQGTPHNMQIEPKYDDLLGEIKYFLKMAITRAENLGIKKSQIIIDPGIGFGKTVAHNLSLINHIDVFHALDVPIMVGHSRKAFIRKTVLPTYKKDLSPDHPLVEIGNQAVVNILAAKDVHIIRAHNVANTVATLKIIKALKMNSIKTGRFKSSFMDS